MIDQLSISPPTIGTNQNPSTLFKWCVENGMGYVSFQLPGLKKAWTMVQESRVRSLQIPQIDFEKTKGFLLAPFQENAKNPILLLEPDWVFPYNQISLPKFDNRFNNLRNATDSESVKFTEEKKESPLSSKKEEYKSLVTSIVKNIKGNKFKKVVASFF